MPEPILCPLRTSVYQPGCSTVAVNPFEQTRMADLISSRVIIEALQGYAPGLQVPDIYAGFISLSCLMLHRIALPVVSKWSAWHVAV